MTVHLRAQHYLTELPHVVSTVFYDSDAIIFVVCVLIVSWHMNF